MNDHKTLVRGLIITGLLLIACVATQVPLNLRSPSIPSVPSFKAPSVAVPSIPSIPTLGIPTVMLPTINAPAVGSTLVNGVLGTPAPTTTAIPAVPVTGGGGLGDALRWALYGVLALIGTIIVITLFARALKRPGGPDEPPSPPDV